tara:strand:- start:25 stop:177 length:153 start_codon:yes stop_codon:yes gene_type:complete
MSIKYILTEIVAAYEDKIWIPYKLYCISFVTRPRNCKYKGNVPIKCFANK